MLYVSLRQLEYIVAIGRTGSLSAASDQLSVSQPALSVAITQVENRIGEQLFIRRKGVAVVPTAFGRLFLTDAEALLAEAERLERPGALSRRKQSRVTLGILDELAPTWLAPILAELRLEFPETELQAVSGSFETLISALLSGQIDLGLTYDLGLDATFQRDLLVRATPWIWISPDDVLADRPTVSLRDIADRPLILSDQGLSIRHMLGLFQTIGVTPLVKHRAASIELLRSLAANGEGTGLSYTNPPGSVAYDGKPVTRIRISDQAAVEPIVLAYTGKQPEPLEGMRAVILKLGRERAGQMADQI
jgi:DNA-binding transcriptional LysR family regulator